MKITVICPLCDKKQEINVDDNIKNAKKLTTINIPKDLICEHNFQAFISNLFEIRGYQKVELQVKKKDLIDNRTIEDKFKSLF